MSTTSDMRRAQFAAICGAAYRGDRALKQRLADALAAVPFESMTDDMVIELAYEFCPADQVTKTVEVCSAVRYEIEQHWLCPDCRDERLFLGDDNRWHRCRRCNPLPEPVEAGAKK